jgi:hypothetical protein
MRHLTKWAVGLALFAFVIGGLACEAIKDKTTKTETMELNLTEDWVPLYAIEVQGIELNALCYNELITVDDLVGETDYADLWDTAKDYLKEIKVESLEYRLANNVSPGGSLQIFLVNNLPDALTLPGGASPEDFGLDIDSFVWILVDPDSLNDNRIVAELPIPAQQNIPDWTEGDFVNDGADRIGNQLEDVDDEFAFCIRLDLPLHGVGDLSPDVEMKVRTVFEMTYALID